MINKENILKRIIKIGDKLIIAKVLDKAVKCDNIGKMLHTDFLDPHQKKIIASILSEIKNLNCIFNGGFDGAERVVLFFCPDFMYDEKKDIESIFIVLSITIKGTEELTHRDYLGAIMGLGIKREKVGDIILNENGCYIIVLSEIADFIIYNLSKVGNCKTVIDTVPLEDIVIMESDKKEINRVVASLRLDCVASAGFGISRTKIVEYIKNEKINLNWETTVEPTKLVKQGDTISIRGKGRITLESEGRVTKKDRIGIVLKKYI
jgi:RNA-binding protein YlmH